MKIRIYTNSTSLNEKQYIFNVLLKDIIGLDFEIGINEELNGLIQMDIGDNLISFNCDFLDRIYPSLYGVWQGFNPEISFVDFKWMQYIEHQIPVLTYTNQQTYSDSELNISIDVFGTSFYFLSNLEEILYHENLDEFGRFNYKNSVLYKYSLLDTPIVNIYIKLLENVINSHGVFTKKNEYSLCLSHDIDSPISVNYSILNLIKSSAADLFIRRDPVLIFKRLLGLLYNRKYDPHFTFDYIIKISNDLNIVSEFNFIVENYNQIINGCYDFDSPLFYEVLKKIHANGHKIGIHPSFNSYDDYKMLEREFKKFNNVLSKLCIEQKITGRQHYLRFKTPYTWRYWDKLGAQKDSSLGSEYFVGFKSSICMPYRVYDLLDRKTLNLIEYPLIAMDVAFFKIGSYDHYFKEIVRISKIVREYGGTFTLLFHNNYLISRNRKKSMKN